MLEASTAKYLPNERDVTDFRTHEQVFRLTTQRLIFEGETKRLFVFPGGRVFSAAMLGDVDCVFLGRQHLLPGWVALLGAAIVLFGLSGPSVIAILLGVALTAVWYFLGGTVLEFRVDGHPLGTMNITSFGSQKSELSGARTFVDRFFAAKSEASRAL